MDPIDIHELQARGAAKHPPKNCAWNSLKR